MLGVSWLSWSAGAGIGVVVLLVLTGRLVPRSVLKDLRADRDERLKEARAEAATWREAFEVSKKSQDALTLYVHQLIELGHTTNSMLRSIPAAGELSSKDGDDAPERT